MIVRTSGLGCPDCFEEGLAGILEGLGDTTPQNILNLYPSTNSDLLPALIAQLTSEGIDPNTATAAAVDRAFTVVSSQPIPIVSNPIPAPVATGTFIASDTVGPIQQTITSITTPPPPSVQMSTIATGSGTISVPTNVLNLYPSTNTSLMSALLAQLTQQGINPNSASASQVDAAFNIVNNNQITSEGINLSTATGAPVPLQTSGGGINPVPIPVPVVASDNPFMDWLGLSSTPSPSLIGGIPNWLIALGGIGALAFLSGGKE